MRKVYQAILTPTQDSGYTVYVPDFDIDTEGEDLADAIEMARDAIGLMGITKEDDGKAIPEPTNTEVDTKEGVIVTYVDVDFRAYRESLDNRSVRKNCTIPFWLNERAEKQGINFSKVLQESLIDTLNIKSAK